MLMKLKDELERQTAIRHQLLDNGYRPLPTAEKVAFQKAWPTRKVDHAEIDSWPMLAAGMRPAVTTAIQLEGTMLAIDIDVQDGQVSSEVTALCYEELGEDFECSVLVRTSGGAKVMLLCRTDEPFNMWKTPKYRDPDGKDHMVEVFGGASTRYFSCYGPHTLADKLERGQYRVLKSYEWIGDKMDPRFVKPDDLPLVPVERLKDLLMKIDDLLAREGGWEKVPGTVGGDFDASVVYDLEPDMVFEMKGGLDLVYHEVVAYAASERDARCSSSFLGDGSSNRSKCRVKVVGHHGEDETLELMVFDHETWTTHYPSSWSPEKLAQERTEKIEALGKALARIMPQAVLEAIEDAQAQDVDTEEFENKLDELLETLAFDTITGRYHHLRRGVIWSGVTRATLMADLRQHDLRWTGPRGGSCKMSIVDAWEKFPDRQKIAGVRFDPRTTARVFMGDDSEVYANGFFGYSQGRETTYSDKMLMALFLEHLVPDPDERLWLLDWLATKYQRPWERNCAVLFVAPGVQGAGRGTLFSILDRVFNGYTSIVSESDLLGARFNGFMENSLLLFCNEVGGMGWAERKRGYETLKDRVDPAHTAITIERKGLDSYRTRTYASFMLATNQPGGLTMDAEDRRIAVITNGDKLEGVMLNNILETGLDRLATALSEMLAMRTIEQAVSDAPAFAGREAMLDANETDLDVAIREVIEAAGPQAAWVRSAFEAAVRVKMTGALSGKVPGLRNAVSQLVGKRAERIGAELLQERVKIGDKPLSVVAKDREHFVALSPGERDMHIHHGASHTGANVINLPKK